MAELKGGWRAGGPAVSAGLVAGLRLVLLDGPLEDADDQGIQGRLVLLGPGGELLVEGGRHPDLEVDDGFGHDATPRESFPARPTTEHARWNAARGGSG